jgi:PKD repeat protein
VTAGEIVAVLTVAARVRQVDTCRMRKGVGMALVTAVLLAQPASLAQTPKPSCTGPQVEIFNNSNVYGVQNGGSPPTFTTKGKAYCVTQLITYHWNLGKGAPPGTIGLEVTTGLGGAGSTIGPFKAAGSSGQGGARDVNWIAAVSQARGPVLINGTYRCVDSAPKTWSKNQQSKGGFCRVYGQAAVNAPPPPKNEEKPQPGVVPKGKLAITASPDTGKPPLNVKFTIKSPKVVQWRVDFGDGQSVVRNGSPPKTLEHTYRRECTCKPKLSVIDDPKAKKASSATTGVLIENEALMRLTANPTSGPAPLKVTFTLGTSVKNIQSWALDFGDGSPKAGGVGVPPKAVGHSYAADCACKATFSVKPGATTAVSTFAQVTVGAGNAPPLDLKANPTGGRAPVVVTFTTSVNIPGQIVSWKLDFGDGQQQGGAGRPPKTINHTYARRGTAKAFLVVVQQQAYGGVQYIVPRNGLAIAVS